MTTTTTNERELASRTIHPGPASAAFPHHWRWWTVVLRGVVAILFGILAIFSPTRAFATLVVLFGVYALIDGILALGLGIRHRMYRRGAMIARGIVSIAAGVITLVWPGISAYALLLVIAFWAIVAGILEIAMAITQRKVIEHEWLLGLEGALSIVFGVLLLLSPLLGAVVLALWVGAYALVFGGMQIETGLRLRRLAPAAGA